MSWAVLLLSGLFEIFAIIALQEYNKNPKAIFILGMVLGFGGSFTCIIYVLKYIDMSIAYAVWTGVGAIGGVFVGVYKYKESKHPIKLILIALILFSVIGLKFA